jgi:ATP-dependent RNA helicase DDX46/PRP5
MKIAQGFVQKENEKNNQFTSEIEINDYPSTVRSKVSSREFLSSIYDLTGCQVMAKGQHFDVGKNPPLGQRKLYLYVEGQSKQEVANAMRELKRVLEEAALNSMALSGATGGRY